MKRMFMAAALVALSFTAFGEMKSMSPVPKIPIEEDKVAAIEAMMIDGNYCLSVPYTERAKWEKSLGDKRRASTIKAGEKLLAPDGTCNMEGWNDEWVEKYWSPKKNNDTNTGKLMHGRRQSTLRKLVFAECVEGQGRFVPAINDCLRKVVRGFWVMPRNYKPEEKVQDIELGANHYASVVGCTLYIMGDKIEPELRQEALDTLYSRVFNPMISSFQPGSKRNFCGWATSLANWNTSCLSGILSAALATIPDKHTRAIFVYLADRYCDNYPAGYTPDGYCTEGMSYYNYGYDKYYFIREMIRNVTKGQIDIFSRNPYIAEMMSYPFMLQMYPDIAPAKNFYPSFGDCSTNTRPASRVVFYNNKYLGLDLPAFRNFDPRATDGGFMGAGIAMFQKYAEDGVEPKEPFDPLRSLFKDCGILTMRPDSDPENPMKKPVGMAVSVKGGHNKEAHNHNDVGSYNICLDGVFMVEDPAIAPYTGRTFGPHRYEIKTLNSYGHACPTVDGTLQATVGERAPIMLTKFTDAKDDFALELKGFYTDVKDVNSMLRTYSYLRDKCEFIVKDDFIAASAHVWESAISTRAEVEVAKNAITLKRDGKTIKATVKSTVPVTITTETIGGPKTEDAKVPFTRIGIKANKPAAKCTMTIDFKAL